MSTTPSRLATILKTTADRLRADLEVARAGQQHPTLRGDVAQAMVRELLTNHLPPSLGVTGGEVVDSLNSTSGQADIIIYDTRRTPMIFTSPDRSSHAVPAEGVVGVVEVKSRLQKKDLPQLVEHAGKLARLEKRAYFTTPISTSYSFYGDTLATFPIIYTVFAFDSDGTYAAELNELQRDVPLNARVDNVLCLDRGLVLNVAIRNVMSSETPVGFSATPLPNSVLAETTQEDGLVPWLAMNASLWAQADVPPISLFPYVRESLVLNPSIPKASVAAFVQLTKDGIANEIAEPMGVRPELARKLMEGLDNVTLSPEEQLELIEAYGGGHLTPDEAVRPTWDQILELPAEYRPSIVRQLIEAARSRETDEGR